MPSSDERNFYLVQPFFLTAKGWRKGQATEHRREQEALLKAELIAPAYEGVAVMRLRFNRRSEQCSEPTVITKIGDVPPEHPSSM